MLDKITNVGATLAIAGFVSVLLGLYKDGK